MKQYKLPKSLLYQQGMEVPLNLVRKPLFSYEDMSILQKS